MRPGDFFSRVYDMPLAVLATSSYREAKGTVQSDLDISDCITGVSQLKGRVLLVDDMVDSGKTIREVIEHLKKRYPEITEIRVAVLWYKAHSVLVPDWHVEYLEDNPWIHQPFEMLRCPRAGQAHRACRSQGSQKGLIVSRTKLTI